MLSFKIMIQALLQSEKTIHVEYINWQSGSWIILEEENLSKGFI